jgi:deoxycytidylate deaminase
VKVLAADSCAARNWLQRLGVGAVLLRPDRYVVGLACERRDVAHLLGIASGCVSQLATT